jgi:hypothetical protein
MRKFPIGSVVASILVASIVAAPSLSAEGNRDSSGSATDNGIMGDNGRMMGSMMNVMRNRSQMMDHCNNMMSASRPNDQWRKNGLSVPEKRE